jgi:signal transduction histidine kinase
VIDTLNHNRYRFLVGCFFAVTASAPGVLSVLGGHRWEVVVVKAAYGIPLLWWNRARFAFWSITIFVLASEVSLAAAEVFAGEWAFIPLIVAAFVLGLRGTPGTEFLGVTGFVAAVFVAVAINRITAAPQWRVGLGPIVTIGLIATSWLLGRETQRIRRRAELAEVSLDQAAVDAQLRSQTAVAEERLRITHDVHDLASHSLSALVIRTEVAQLRLSGHDDQLAAEIRAIGDDGRRAMEQLRSMLATVPIGIDSSFDSDRGHGVDLHRLLTVEVDSFRRNKASAAATLLHMALEDVPLVSVEIGTALQRFLREALMNAHQYAPSALINVAAQQEDFSLVVSVTNGSPLHQHVATPNSGSGLGLVLTRERLSRCGATLDARPTVDGGWTATVTVPWRHTMAPPR